jgi:predicted branched-subunit amino acid permease
MLSDNTFTLFVPDLFQKRAVRTKFDFYVFLFLAWWPSWLKVGITGRIIGFFMNFELLPILTDYAN